MRQLLLADAGLDGSVPAELGLLAELTRIDLDGNDAERVRYPVSWEVCPS